MKQSNLNQEEEALRGKLEEVEFSYQADDWNALEKQLPKQGGFTMSKWLKAGLVVVAAAGASYLMFSGDEELSPSPKAESQTKIEAIESKQELSAENTSPQNIKQEASTTQIKEGAKIEQKESSKTNQAVSKEAAESNESDDLTQTASSDLQLDQKNETTQLVEEKSKVNEANALDYNFQSGFIFEGKLCKNSNIIVSPRDQNLLAKAERYVWKLNGKVVGQSAEKIEISLDEEELYHLQLEVWSNLADDSQLTFDTTFKATAIEEANFTYHEKSGLFTDFEVDFTSDNESENLDLTWIIEGQRLKGGAEQTYQFPSEGIYTVSLEVMNENGCKTQVQKPVSVQNDFTPFINAFTPDNQGPSENNTFIPNGFEDFDGNFTFTVYNLQTNVVYQSTSIHEPWNGRLNNKGALLPAGYYVWKVNVSDNKGNQRAFTDKVELRK